MILNGACYIRVSTEDQTEYSPDAQLRLLGEHAKKNGIHLLDEHIYIDAGISGRKADKRPAFMKMIAIAKTKPKPFDIILVHKFDRFARSREDSVVYKSLLKKEAGIKVVSITESIEDDKFSVILEAMLEAMAEYYSLNLSDEVKKGMMEKARRGGVLGRAPFGYQNNGKDKPFTIISEEAEIVKMIFNKIYLKEMTPFSLARYLNARGLYTRNGQPWSTYTLKYLLSNSTYTGLSIWNRQTRSTMKYKDRSEWIIFNGKHEPIIDKEIFNEVQKILTISKFRGERPASQYCHWLSGLVKCSNCSGSLSVSSIKKYPAFQCHHYNKGNCSQSHYIPVHVMERLVIDSLKDFFGSSSINFQYEKRSALGKSEFDKLPLLYANLKKAQEKLNRVKSAFATGIDTINEYRENKAEIILEIDNIQNEIEKAKPKNNLLENSRTTHKCIKEALDIVTSSDYSIEEKNSYLKSFISKIVFNKSLNKIEVFYFCD